MYSPGLQKKNMACWHIVWALCPLYVISYTRDMKNFKYRYAATHVVAQKLNFIFLF